MSQLEDKILDVLTSRRVASLATVTEDCKPWVRYVVVTASAGFTLTFATHRQSRKVGQIRANPEVHLTTGVNSLETARQYVQVQATARVITDPDALNDFWKESLNDYFSGPDDPNYCLVAAKPYRIEYFSATSMEPEVWTAA